MLTHESSKCDIRNQHFVEIKGSLLKLCDRMGIERKQKQFLECGVLLSF